jgi:hypothetical protein
MTSPPCASCGVGLGQARHAVLAHDGLSLSILRPTRNGTRKAVSRCQENRDDPGLRPTTGEHHDDEDDEQNGDECADTDIHAVLLTKTATLRSRQCIKQPACQPRATGRRSSNIAAAEDGRGDTGEEGQIEPKHKQCLGPADIRPAE